MYVPTNTCTYMLMYAWYICTFYLCMYSSMSPYKMGFNLDLTVLFEFFNSNNGKNDWNIEFEVNPSTTAKSVPYAEIRMKNSTGIER